ncbi:hypothetical protein EYF80_005669 [Liparis tanakae]|uniref:Uncharacterized protein n=1 Tax=Liparis tanakae TaxID=230148 RepID=A0A4Z2J3I9_9TELE|nr:hypothetical protein EYF80_005669 [Liparis tanakae]
MTDCPNSITDYDALQKMGSERTSPPNLIIILILILLLLVVMVASSEVEVLWILFLGDSHFLEDVSRRPVVAVLKSTN